MRPTGLNLQPDHPVNRLGPSHESSKLQSDPLVGICRD